MNKKESQKNLKDLMDRFRKILADRSLAFYEKEYFLGQILCEYRDSGVNTVFKMKFYDFASTLTHLTHPQIYKLMAKYRLGEKFAQIIDKLKNVNSAIACLIYWASKRNENIITKDILNRIDKMYYKEAYDIYRKAGGPDKIHLDSHRITIKANTEEWEEFLQVCSSAIKKSDGKLKTTSDSIKAFAWHYRDTVLA